MLIVSIISIVLNVLMFILLTKLCNAFNKTGENLIQSIFRQDTIINSIEKRLKKCEKLEERISYLEIDPEKRKQAGLDFDGDWVDFYNKCSNKEDS